MNNVGAWTLYAVVYDGSWGGIPGTDPWLYIDGSSNTKIDELRLYPANASMTTTTYEPLYGPNSACDAHNNILYFDYDAQGRQTTVRDINHNIISYTKQVIQGGNN